MKYNELDSETLPNRIRNAIFEPVLKLLYVLLSFISLVLKSGNITNSALKCTNGHLKLQTNIGGHTPDRAPEWDT